MTTSSLDIGALLTKAAEIAKDPHRFGEYYNDPVGFQRDILGWEPWGKQIEVLEALVTNTRIAVKSGHGTGKTRDAAGAVLWWTYAREGLVVTTAPTKEHVEDVLWREINMLARNSKVSLPGECTATRHRITDTWYADGITTNKPGAFQGRHHPRLLMVIDEAAGVEEAIHLEAAMLATGEENCILLIGNPTTTSGTFYDAFNRYTNWKRITISCFDHPNVVSGNEGILGAVTRGWVDEQRLKWGESSALWHSRVLGEFPSISNRGVIPPAWVDRAQDEERRISELEHAVTENIPRVGGLDVARYGENVCVCVIRRGDAVETILSWSHASLMETTGRAMEIIEKYQLPALVVDASGIGAGVCDRLRENGAPVFDYNGGHRAFTPSTFSNRRTELWWTLRTRFEKQRIWIPRIFDAAGHDQLKADLIAPQYDIISSGRIRVETKESLMQRNIKSPDYADALTMSFALDEDPLAVAPTVPGPTVADSTELFPSGNLSDFPSLPSGF